MTTGLQDRPSTTARVRFVRMSASKVRVVLNLIRNKSVTEAIDILEFGERLAADEVLKALRSAIANAEHNEDIPIEELFVSACFADEGPTLKRFRPRARGRAGRIHKQTCHITLELARFTQEEVDEMRKRNELKEEGRTKRGAAKKKASGGDRSKRVAKSKKAEATAAPEADDVSDEVEVEEVETDEVAAEEVAAEEVEETAAVEEETVEEVEAAEAVEEEVVEESEATDDSVAETEES